MKFRGLSPTCFAKGVSEKMIHRVITPVSTALISAVFLWAGVAKAMRREDFFNAIGHYHLLPLNAAYRLSLWIPWLEIALAVALLVPVKIVRRAAALVLLAMLLLFTAGLITLWIRGENVNCGCFGGMGKSHPAWSILRNLALLACAWRVFRDTKRAAVQPIKSPSIRVVGPLGDA